MRITTELEKLTDQSKATYEDGKFMSNQYRDMVDKMSATKSY